MKIVVYLKTFWMKSVKMRFQLRNIRHLRNSVQERILGSGGFATVSIHRCCDSNEQYVVKELDVSKLHNVKYDQYKKYEMVLEILINEYTIGKMIEHPNVIKPLDYDIRNLCIIYENAVGTDFLDLLNKDGCSIFLLQKMGDIIEAVEHLHENGIAHMDIKLENILLENITKCAKLIDFGQAKIYRIGDVEIMSKNMCGTTGYFPPEFFKNVSYIPSKVDVWCCGIVLYNLIFDKMPWENANIQDQRFKVCHICLKRNKLHSEVFSPFNYKIPRESITERDIEIFNTIFTGVFTIDFHERINMTQLKLLMKELSFIS